MTIDLRWIRWKARSQTALKVVGSGRLAGGKRPPVAIPPLYGGSRTNINMHEERCAGDGCPRDFATFPGSASHK